MSKKVAKKVEASESSDSEEIVEHKEEDPHRFLHRAPNAYLLYAQEQRPILVTEHTDLTHKQILSLIGEKWKALDDDEKKVWKKEKIKGKLRPPFKN